MRIARLSEENRRTQGPARRQWYERHSAAHLREIERLVAEALATRDPASPAAAVVLGAGACTEIPLERLARELDSVLLVDVDVGGMTSARDTLPANLRGKVDLLQADITGGVSDSIASDLRLQPWADLVALGPMAPVDAAASVVERCHVPDPPEISGLAAGAYGIVVSSMVLTQLFGLPILDVADALLVHAPEAAELREGSSRYVEAIQHMRRKVSLAHLDLLRELLAPGGSAVLASDTVGRVVSARDASHRTLAANALNVLPPEVLRIPGDLTARFTLSGGVRTWTWDESAPSDRQYGRTYEVIGMLLHCAASA